nr:interleukin-15 receptor subunit alpha isoform X2 [Kogia breviceps]
MFLGKKDAAGVRKVAVPGARQGSVRSPGLRSRSGPGRTGQVTGPAAPRRYPRCHSASPARTSGTRGHSFARLLVQDLRSRSNKRRQARRGDRVEPKPGITCPAPTSVKHADIRVKSYNLNSRERYVCNSGFKRKAGTSSLTECVFNKTLNLAHWTTPNLKCIRDASLTHQRPPSTAAPTGVTPEPDNPNPSGKGAYQYNPRAVTAAVSMSVTVLCGVCVVCLLVHYVRYIRSRQAYQIPSVEMESMEVVPMTGGTSARGEGTEN